MALRSPWRLVGLAMLLALGGARADAPPATVYVWLPTSGRPAAVQKALEAALPNARVTAFGRVGDFRAALESAPPDAVLSLPVVLRDVGLSPALQGQAGGADAEPWVLVSVGEGLDRAALAGAAVGAVDLVGRKQMPKFVAGLLSLPSAPRVQIVTKVDDLLPLLQFKSADAVVMPERKFSDFQERSRLPLKSQAFDSARVEHPAVAFPRPDRRPELERAFNNLSQETLRLLGVDRWKSR